MRSKCDKPHGAKPLDQRSKDITSLLARIGEGSDSAANQLFPLVYEELRAMAAQYMGQERSGHTLQPTALVHEAYVRLVNEPEGGPKNRAHFFALAARAMRRVLIESARRHKSQKRGSDLQRVSLHEGTLADKASDVDVLDLDEAMTRLAELDSRKAQIVEMRFFAGLTNEEVAENLRLSRKTVVDDWTVARAWLSRELRKGLASDA